ncbi:hypothetical protein ACNI3K_10675 [Demequina sp. SO4-13]|uniref:hypothetical protein n=1 Tax=Demequina sp. SO4-13 TaxID=3401027 RepID=UPI003AF81C18
MDVSLLAGSVSTALFAAANAPMLAKALRTRDLSSYSLPALVVSNAGNVIHTVYVMSLPVGPIWVLHGFYLVSMAVMVTLYIRQARAVSPVSSARGSVGDTMKDACHAGLDCPRPRGVRAAGLGHGRERVPEFGRRQ